MPAIEHPAFGGPVNYSVTYVPDDPDGQVAGTIALMCRYAKQDSQTAEIQRDALEAVGGSRDGMTDRQCIEAVWRYVNGRVSFVEDGQLTGFLDRQDPDNPAIEALIRPVDMAVMCEGSGCGRVGDCDDFSMYVAALLLALGIKCKFVTVAADSAAPDRMSHVYVAAYTRDGQRIPVDASHGPHCGWETPNATRIKEWTIGVDLVGLVVVGLLAYGLAKYGGYL